MRNKGYLAQYTPFPELDTAALPPSVIMGASKNSEFRDAAQGARSAATGKASTVSFGLDSPSGYATATYHKKEYARCATPQGAQKMDF
ncbi:MAG: hypothetical protein HY846_11130 [Nitrosomonadales bacterium]|nr:hypothetical protein [Nitrosomonadales bacterium]